MGLSCTVSHPHRYNLTMTAPIEAEDFFRIAGTAFKTEKVFDRHCKMYHPEHDPQVTRSRLTFCNADNSVAGFVEVGIQIFSPIYRTQTNLF